METLAQVKFDEDTLRKLCRVKVSASSQAIMSNVWKGLVPFLVQKSKLTDLLTG